MAHRPERSLAFPMAFAAAALMVWGALGLSPQPPTAVYTTPTATVRPHAAAAAAAGQQHRPCALAPTPSPSTLGAPHWPSAAPPAASGAPFSSHWGTALGWAAAMATGCAWLLAHRPSAPDPAARLESLPLAMFAAAGETKRSQAECLNDSYLLACRQVFTSLDMADNLDPATASSILLRSLKHGKVLLTDTELDAASGTDVYVNWPAGIWGDMDRARDWGLTHLLRGRDILRLLDDVRGETIMDIMRDIPDSDLSLEVTRSQPPLVYAVLFLSATLAFLLADVRHGGDAAAAREAALRAVTRVKLALGFTSSPRVDLPEILDLVEASYR